MRLEANNVGSVDHREIQGSGGIEQHPCKPANLMVGGDIFIRHRGSFLVLIQQRNLFLGYGLIDHGGRGRRSSLATYTSNTLRADGSTVTGDVGVLVSFTGHGGVEGAEV
jgi:hypothetical protein